MFFSDLVHRSVSLAISIAEKAIDFQCTVHSLCKRECVIIDNSKLNVSVGRDLYIRALRKELSGIRKPFAKAAFSRLYWDCTVSPTLF